MIVHAPRTPTLSELLERIGDVPLCRIRFDPPPGSATVEDVIRLDDHEDRLCELIDGVLVEKAMGFHESLLAVFLGRLLGEYVDRRNLGVVAGEAATLQLFPDLVRIPDVCFVSWDRMPDRKLPAAPVPHLVPNLAVEVLSKSNTKSEMAAKRRDYFSAGVELVWEIDPKTRTVAVYRSAADVATLGSDEVLDAGEVLPGFQLPLRDLFATLDRQG